MREWFIPIYELIKRIEYVDKKVFMEARLDGQLIGQSDCDPRFLDQWKKNIVETIGQFSSTIILETLCGCTKLVEQTDRHIKNHREPLKCRMSFVLSDDSDSSSVCQHIREFEETSRYGVMGLRIFEEKPIL